MIEEKLTYHKDITQKRPITEQDIDFLSSLQKEMNTQDTLGQADPRFWVVRGTERVFGPNEDYMIIAEDGTEYTSFEDIACFVKKAACDAFGTESVEVDCDDGGFMPYMHIRVGEGTKQETRLFGFGELAEWLSDNGYEVRCEPYADIPKNYDSTFFMTRKAAREHLEQNHYHYSSDAHTYAMTAWRNPEADRLWEILRKVDFEALRGAACREGK